MKQWPMTDAEIKRSWRCAEDRKAQIRILGELNGKTRQEVILKLDELGIDLSDVIDRKHVRFSEEEDRKIWQMRQNGDAFCKIAAALGVKGYFRIMHRYDELMKEYQQAKPLIERALKRYANGDPRATAEEKTMIRTLIRRGI